MKKPFRERIKEGPIVADGAMGTLLDLYEYAEQPHEIQNLKNPDIIERIHREYIKAGAEIIEANTFSANRLRLTHYHLEDKLAAINIAGVTIAKQAAHGTNVYIAGAIGPSGMMLEPIGNQKRKRGIHSKSKLQYFAKQVDLLMMETLVSIAELDEAIHAAKELTDIPIVAQKHLPKMVQFSPVIFLWIVIEHLIAQGADIVEEIVRLVRSVCFR